MAGLFLFRIDTGIFNSWLVPVPPPHPPHPPPWSRVQHASSFSLMVDSDVSHTHGWDNKKGIYNQPNGPVTPTEIFFDTKFPGLLHLIPPLLLAYRCGPSSVKTTISPPSHLLGHSPPRIQGKLLELFIVLHYTCRRLASGKSIVPFAASHRVYLC